MLVDISKVKLNPENPRLIKDQKFQKLVESVKKFPKMLELRPIIVDEKMVILGGNMRFRACKEAGLKKVHIQIAKNLTEDEKNEFIIKDNVSFGEWDWEILANEWDTKTLVGWGMEVWEQPREVDMSLLDGSGDSKLNLMADGVRKAIQIEFEPKDYGEAYELVTYFRDKGEYVGMLLIELLRKLKK